MNIHIQTIMSGSLASAKRRRAGLQPSSSPSEAPPPIPIPVATPNPPPITAAPISAINGRMSLPQLLSNLENRINAIERKEPVKQVAISNAPPLEFNVTDPDTGEERKMTLSDYMTDMDKKFFMLAEEITTMKDIVIKLQSYTMDVNKMLMEKMNVTMSVSEVKTEE